MSKEPWQMTAATYQRTNNWLQYRRYASLNQAKRGETALKRRYPFYETRLEKISTYSDAHDVLYRLSHEQVVKNALATGKSVPIKVLSPPKPGKRGGITATKVKATTSVKEVWQMTKKEFVERARRWKDLSPKQQLLAQKEYIEQTGDEEGAKESKVMSNWFYDKHTGRVLGEDIETHDWYIKQAIAQGKPVPEEVLADYLMPVETPSAPKATPLPPDAQNVQTVPFDSQLFDCYGKQTKRGFRAYCRRR